MISVRKSVQIGTTFHLILIKTAYDTVAQFPRTRKFTQKNVITDAFTIVKNVRRRYNIVIDMQNNKYIKQFRISIKIRVRCVGRIGGVSVSRKNKKKRSKSQPDVLINSDSDKLTPSESENVSEITEEIHNGVRESEAAVSCGISESSDTASENAHEKKADASCDFKNEFERSLFDFSEEDACAEKTHASHKGLNIFRILIFLLCITACALSLITLAQNIYGKYKTDRIYGELAEKFSGDSFNIDGSETKDSLITLLAPDKQIPYTPTMDDIIANGISGDIVSKKSYTEELFKMRAALSSLASINSDIYGWIKVPGTRIDYPIAQAGDNEYYLDRAYTGDNLVTGSIFADFRCSPKITENYNTVLYGHNVNSGQMFHDVETFFSPDVFENTNIYLYTFDGIYIFKPFSVHEASYDSGYIDTYFETGDTFREFAENLRSLSDIGSDAEFTADSRILTLSTCTNGIATRRYALHAVLCEIITD